MLQNIKRCQSANHFPDMNDFDEIQTDFSTVVCTV